MLHSRHGRPSWIPCRGIHWILNPGGWHRWSVKKNMNILLMAEIPNNQPGMVLKPLVNNGIKYQSQLVSRISAMNSIIHDYSWKGWKDINMVKDATLLKKKSPVTDLRGRALVGSICKEYTLLNWCNVASVSVKTWWQYSEFVKVVEMNKWNMANTSSSS